ncbi:DnaJ-domain-containing protein [Calocera viscosa TUFC12733]|uniref:DnaJ-domain-containing protein n=1 Tax=Calocera viscosa (strain TUFC12733) TaxID=1330018 RepID=A0A167JPA3_CALVF|nr:DnaJ-domain-containing protein [Calocera viscosa TUFC12733]
MAQYSYDESGSMAHFLVLTFLAGVLVPLTYSFVPSTGKSKDESCTCSECREKEQKVHKRNQKSLLSLRVGPKALLTIALWGFFIYTLYRVANLDIDSAIYDPFAILGIRAGSTESDIRRHYRRLSLKFHPDKVKLAVNETLEMVQEKFVTLTKAYKSLTDETVRRNLELYGHPDGKQEYSVGIAIPRWIVEGQNNIWVLGVYGVVFGVGLPFLVGRWWFTSRKLTRDRVQGATATVFFKNLRDKTDYPALVELLGHSWELECPGITRSAHANEALDGLVKTVREKVPGWAPTTELDRASTRRATALLWAHLLRLPLPDQSLQHGKVVTSALESQLTVSAEQDDLLLQTRDMLKSMLSIALAHNWLSLSVKVMRLQAALAQAVVPGSPRAAVKQLPKIKNEEVSVDAPDNVETWLKLWQKFGDARLEEAKKAFSRWGRLEVVDAYFKVIDEKVVTPGAIVFLVLKLRLQPPAILANGQASKSLEQDTSKPNNYDETAFLLSRKEAEDLPKGAVTPGLAHAPRWPEDRRPGWWVLIGDRRTDRVVVPPIRITNVPLSDESRPSHNYRTYKMQFQAPPQIAIYPFSVHIISDTYIGEDAIRDVKLQVVDPAVLGADADVEEDEISDPDEDTLEGQLAAMKGGRVKPSPIHGDADGDEDEEEDEESGTDDDSDDDSSDSDSD